MVDADDTDDALDAIDVVDALDVFDALDAFDADDTFDALNWISYGMAETHFLTARVHLATLETDNEPERALLVNNASTNFLELFCTDGI